MKYTVDGSVVCRSGSAFADCYSGVDAGEVAAELNRLLAERDEARRDRDVLAVFIRGGAPLNHGEYFAALSRCTPPATEATNG